MMEIRILKHRMLSILMTAVFVFAAGSCVDTTTSKPAYLTVHVIDVGQADSILIDLGPTEVLIDAGEETADQELVNYLKPLVQGALEAVVVTHPDSDHIGGVPAVFSAFEIKQVWHSGNTATTGVYDKFLNALRDEHADERTANRGKVITVGAISLKVLNPEDLSGSTNHTSVVMSLVYGRISFLFTGDADRQAEADMLANGLISHADILKVGHHGSRTASSPDFLSKLQPAVAIYSAGGGYEHPHPETISALQNIGAAIYGTDVNGTIDVKTDGETYTVQPERGQAR